MKIWCGILITLVCLFLPGVLATTIIYNSPSVGPGINASVTAGTGIVVTGNGSIILISFDTIWGGLQYYPYSTNPTGYLTNFTETDPVFTGENASIWAAINNKLNITDQRYNNTIIAYTTTTLVNVSGGIANVILSIDGFVVTELIITPTTNTTTYRFAAKNGDGSVIDRDRILHIGTWDIRKYAVINGTITLNITNSTADETFNTTIKYLNNAGVVP